MGLPMDTELAPKMRAALFQYDFSVHGGAVGDITLYGNPIPDDALVIGGMIRTKTNLTSGGAATVQLKLVGTDDVQVLLDVTGLQPGEYTVIPDVTVPNEVMIESLIPEAISVTIERNVSTEPPFG